MAEGLGELSNRNMQRDMQGGGGMHQLQTASTTSFYPVASRPTSTLLGVWHCRHHKMVERLAYIVYLIHPIVRHKAGSTTLWLILTDNQSNIYARLLLYEPHLLASNQVERGFNDPVAQAPIFVTTHNCHPAWVAA